MKKILLTLLLLSFSFESNAARSDYCPATLTLSDFSRAMEYSAQGRDLEVGLMEANGDIFKVPQDTYGEIDDVKVLRVNGAIVSATRFVYDGNPNGFYGVWLPSGCIYE